MKDQKNDQITKELSGHNPLVLFKVFNDFLEEKGLTLTQAQISSHSSQFELMMNEKKGEDPLGMGVKKLKALTKANLNVLTVVENFQRFLEQKELSTEDRAQFLSTAQKTLILIRNEERPASVQKTVDKLVDQAERMVKVSLPVQKIIQSFEDSLDEKVSIKKILDLASAAKRGLRGMKPEENLDHLKQPYDVKAGLKEEKKPESPAQHGVNSLIDRAIKRVNITASKSLASKIQQGIKIFENSLKDKDSIQKVEQLLSATKRDLKQLKKKKPESLLERQLNRLVDTAMEKISTIANDNIEILNKVKKFETFLEEKSLTKSVIEDLSSSIQKELITIRNFNQGEQRPNPACWEAAMAKLNALTDKALQKVEASQKVESPKQSGYFPFWKGSSSTASKPKTENRPDSPSCGSGS